MKSVPRMPDFLLGRELGIKEAYVIKFRVVHVVVDLPKPQKNVKDQIDRSSEKQKQKMRYTCNRCVFGNDNQEQLSENQRRQREPSDTM